MKLRELLFGNSKNDIIMKRFLEKLQVAAFVAMIVFASGDTYANLVAVVTAAAILGCCELKLKELADD